MIHAANPVLNQAPQPLDGIGVNVAFDVDAIGMLDVLLRGLQVEPTRVARLRLGGSVIVRRPGAQARVVFREGFARR
jgi:hypothetical protein